MLISRQREKLLNAIIYFVKNTNYVGKVKLFKLLFFLDFEHFKETGRDVTGLEYKAYGMGPLPEKLNAEIDFPEPDMKEHVKFENIQVAKGWMLQLTPVKEFDSSHFSKRELRILESLAHEHRDHNANEMIDATHLEESPWHRVYEIEGRVGQVIPHEYAFKNDNIPGDIQEKIQDHEEMVRNYS